MNEKIYTYTYNVNSEIKIANRHLFDSILIESVSFVWSPNRLKNWKKHFEWRIKWNQRSTEAIHWLEPNVTHIHMSEIRKTTIQRWNNIEKNKFEKCTYLVPSELYQSDILPQDILRLNRFLIFQLFLAFHVWMEDHKYLLWHCETL